MPHNHPPRCCCGQPDHSIRTQSDTCPSCIEHGELATLGNSEYTATPDRGTGWSHHHPDGQRWHHPEGEPCEEGNGMPDFERALTECPSCHQLPGRAPTDYCQQPDWHSVMLTANPDGSTTWTQTTQPATRTTTPPTQVRNITRHPDHCAHTTLDNCGICTKCGTPISGPTPLATPTPGYPAATCSSCDRSYDDTPGHHCIYPSSHDHPR